MPYDKYASYAGILGKWHPGSSRYGTSKRLSNSLEIDRRFARAM
ncbi:predicted protein [Botrytis cinerea T4]|uniref:Uncharacterized protein n=1 Tax=Botryotinia fuckeliana (strain T4) TaxID=999810 RepID=G2XUM4_BOTF4|nr:predicted protein [Botrytis cinerea T4]